MTSNMRWPFAGVDGRTCCHRAGLGDHAADARSDVDPSSGRA
jgi:hypothetical protein